MSLVMASISRPPSEPLPIQNPLFLFDDSHSDQHEPRWWCRGASDPESCMFATPTVPVESSG